jgi:hypothetical protein
MNVQPPNILPSGVIPTPDGRDARPLKATQQENAEIRPDELRSSLWEILTPEEREFFEMQESMGPMTYRPNGGFSETGAAPTGRRIDVRG